MSSINHNHFLKDSGYSNHVDSTGLPRHRWYYYKEGFSPLLVSRAIDEVGLKKGSVILDPFNGSGTTTLEASIRGYTSVGLEVNPFTAFLSDTKSKSVKRSDIESVQSGLISSVEKGSLSNLDGFSTFTESSNLSKWLFNSDILKGFEGGWNFSKSISVPELKNLVQLALIVSAMDNCNATRDGKCLRYRQSWKSYLFSKETFLESVRKNLDRFINDIETQPINAPTRIIQGDARNILKNNNSIGTFDLCITSPPYLNTFDYTDIYRPELFLGKFVNSREELYNLRLKTVRSHIQATWEKPKVNDFGILYNQTVNHLNDNVDSLMHKRIPSMVQAYFEDMFNVLKDLKSRSKKSSQLWLVVSNSAYCNEEIPVDLIIADIGCKAGWFLKEVALMRYISRRKTKYSQDINQLRESVIVFSASK